MVVLLASWVHHHGLCMCLPDAAAHVSHVRSQFDTICVSHVGLVGFAYPGERNLYLGQAQDANVKARKRYEKIWERREPQKRDGRKDLQERLPFLLCEKRSET